MRKSKESMEELEGWIWMDGKFIPWRDAKVHILSYTFQHGVGVFEGIRAYAGAGGTAVFRLNDHAERFFDSAKIVQMTIPVSKAEFSGAIQELIRKSGLVDCYLRPLAYYDGRVVGVSAHGNQVHIAIAAWEWRDYHGKSAQHDGIRICTSSVARNYVGSAFGKAKANGHYVNAMLAHSEATRNGCDDGLMLDVNGLVSECSTSNIFMVKNNAVSTPSPTSILKGITRDSVIQFLRDCGTPVLERDITRDELYCADELFITGTAAEVTPVVEYDGRRIADGKPGTLTRSVQATYRRAVTGQLEQWRHWLTDVS